jgi:hypothetical protein
VNAPLPADWSVPLVEWTDGELTTALALINQRRGEALLAGRPFAARCWQRYATEVAVALDRRVTLYREVGAVLAGVDPGTAA